MKYIDAIKPRIKQAFFELFENLDDLDLGNKSAPTDDVDNVVELMSQIYTMQDEESAQNVLKEIISIGKELGTEKQKFFAESFFEALARKDKYAFLYFEKIVTANLENEGALNKETALVASYVKVAKEEYGFMFSAAVEEETVRQDAYMELEDIIVSKNKKSLNRFLEENFNKIDYEYVFEDGESLINKVIKSGNAEFVEMFLEKCAYRVDFNQADSGGKTPLLIAIDAEEAQILRLILQYGKTKGLNVDLVDEKGFYPICYATNNPELLKILMDYKGIIKFDQEDEEGKCLIDYAYIFGKSYKLQDVLKMALGTEANPEVLEKFEELLKARMILKLLYSEQDYGLGIRYAQEIILDFASKADYKYKDQFLKALQVIDDKKVKKIDEKNAVQVLNVTIDGHAVYLVVKYSDGKAQKAFLCEGNCYFGQETSDKHKYGALLVEFDGAKIDTSQEGFAERLESLIYKDKELFQSLEYFDHLAMALGSVVKGGLEPDSLSGTVVVSPQNRGNCTAKSEFIAMRALLQEMYSEFDFSMVDQEGKPCGDGHDAFKEFKSAIVNKAISVLVEVSKEADSDLLRSLCLQTCEMAKEKAQSKGNKLIENQMNDTIKEMKSVEKSAELLSSMVSAQVLLPEELRNPSSSPVLDVSRLVAKRLQREKNGAGAEI